MIKYFEMDIDENIFLKKYGSNIFQSLKKLLGMLECEDDNIFLTDSETQFIRNIHIEKEFENTKTVLYSYKYENNTQIAVSHVNNKILGTDKKTPLIGFTFSYQWLYKKNIISTVFESCKTNIIKYVLEDDSYYFFIEDLIYKYCFCNNVYYIFKDVTKLLSYTNAEHFWINATNNTNDKNIIKILNSFHNLFCYSIQNTGNDEINKNIILEFTNFKIVTSTPTTIDLTNISAAKPNTNNIRLLFNYKHSQYGYLNNLIH